MDEQKPQSHTLFPHETGHHHLSARERQRRGPMWGCLRTMLRLFLIAFVLLLVLPFVVEWILQSARFEEYVARRIETTLEARLGRAVTIGSVEVKRARLFEPTQVILHDLRIANAPGGSRPYFARVEQLVITGGIDSFRTRTIRVGRIDVVRPQVMFEIFPEGSALTHNFPSWKSGPRSRYEIYHLDFNKMYVRQASFLFLDRRHDISAEAARIDSELTITRAEDLYAGVLASPRLRLRIQEYEPVDLTMRGGFRFTPGVLALESIALRGENIEAFVSGRIDPLAQGVYNLRIAARTGLERVAQIFRVERPLEGPLSLDLTLRGRQGDFDLSGKWVSPRLLADTYELADLEGRLRLDGQKVLVDIERARYGGGDVNAHYTLSQLREPYPMSVDLRFQGVSIESLFADWGMENTGLRGAATGALTYAWNKDRVLQGSGHGRAQLSRNAVAFSRARYPIPVAGSTTFALQQGTVLFRELELDTNRSHVSLTGSLRIDDLITDLQMRVRSEDFSELDRIAYNFAHAADKADFQLLGLGGSGTITGSVRGPIRSPSVDAQIRSSGTRYNNVLLGSAEIELRYEGPRNQLIFERALFRESGGRLLLTGTVTFPDRGPSPRFDLAIDAAGYPVERAIQAINLEFNVGGGLATGKLAVSGTPDAGRVRFAGVTINQRQASLRLTGDVIWADEEEPRFNLDIEARDYPVEDIVAFLDLGAIPIAGRLTGTLHLEGPKNRLQGAGAITVREGAIYGEPVDVASAEIAFTEGRLRATNVRVSAPAGTITGEAEFDLTTQQFSYNIEAGAIDLSRLKILAALENLFGGKLNVRSTGAGTMENPELVLEATLDEASLQGLALPGGTPAPTLYIAIRGGRLVVRGSIADAVRIEGEGTVAENLAVDGLVRITISDLQRALALYPPAATIPASGNAVIDLQLGGALTSLEALLIQGSVPTFNLRVSEQEFVPREPLRFTLRNGRLTLDSFALLRNGAVFQASGFADLTGAQRLGVDVRGTIEAALLQLFVPDVEAEGLVSVNLDLRGTLPAPVMNGFAELQDAQLKLEGFPQLIDDITGRIEFSGDELRVQSVRATVGGGEVLIGGTIGLSGLAPQRANISLKGTDVSLRYFEGVTVEGRFDLVLTGDLDRSIIQGDVFVTRALYYRDFDLQQSILNVVLARRGIVPIVAASWQDNVALDVRVEAPGTLAIENNIADVTAAAELELRGTLANPIILGVVDLEEGGTVTFQNIDYRVARGSINFQNPFRIDPYFDVTLEGVVNSDISEVESGPIELTVNITGTLDRITPSITSDPPASDITLFSILGLGGLTRQGEGGALQGGDAALLGQSLLLQSLTSALGSRILPFADSFTYDPGLIDTGSGAEPKVSFEKRLSNRIRLLVVYNLTSHDTKEVIEWQVSRDWTAQITRDEQESEYHVDARFRRRYLGHWTWGDRGRPDLFPVQSVAEAVAPSADQPPPPPTTRVASIPAGVTVGEIRFRADGNFDVDAVRKNVTFEVGQPLSRRELQSSIRALFATGNFRDIRVDASPVGDSAVVTFTLSLNYRIGEIDYEGVSGGNLRRAQREVALRPGDVLSLNAVDDAAVEIQEELRQFGYLEATVDPETSFRREENRADVTFHVTTGPQAKIADVILEGNLGPFTRDELLNRLREKPGEDFRLSEVRRDAERLKNFLLSREHRRARVELVQHAYDPAADAVTLRYRVDAGPKVRVEVQGVPRRAVRRLLPFDRNQEYSADVIDRAADEIALAYQQRGYFNATVDTESGMQGDTWVTTFLVEPGQRYRLTEVDFSGNTKLPDRELERLVETSPAGGFRRILATLFRRPTGVTREQLREDREAIESYYRLQGFAEATVGTPVVQTSAKGTMSVTFPVTEGPQTIVSQVNVEGLESFEAGALPSLQLEEGAPLNPQLLREDLLRLQTFYAERGHAEVQVTHRLDISDDKTAARVHYLIAEGPQIEIDEVTVRGNSYTNSEVILRQADLDSGDPFSYTALLEAQRSLYRLGIFQRVDIQPEQAGTSVDDRNLTIEVEEGRNLTVTGSIGARWATGSTEDEDRLALRLAGALSHRNLFGTGRYLGLEAVSGGSREQEFFLTYREPFVGRYNVPVQLTVFQTEDATIRDRLIRQRGTSVEASKVARFRTRWSALYQYKISECVRGAVCDLVSEDIFVPGLDRSLLDIQISSVTPTFFWDRRDDIIDPRRGFFTSASVEYAFPLFSAKANFLKEFLQGAWYLPVSGRSTVALSARIGFIQALANDDVLTGEDESFIPLSERFTAGGDTSHRAYPLDLLGTLCDEEELQENPACRPTLFRLCTDEQGMARPCNPGEDGRIVPLGGNSLFVFNAEYRFPVFSSVGGAIFADIGNVFAGSGIDLSDLRYGVGAGIRYLSPVGPLRLDVGFPLGRRPYERAFSYSITLGYAF